MSTNNENPFSQAEQVHLELFFKQYGDVLEKELAEGSSLYIIQTVILTLLQTQNELRFDPDRVILYIDHWYHGRKGNLYVKTMEETRTLNKEILRTKYYNYIVSELKKSTPNMDICAKIIHLEYTIGGATRDRAVMELTFEIVEELSGVVAENLQDTANSTADNKKAQKKFPWKGFLVATAAVTAIGVATAAVIVCAKR